MNRFALAFALICLLEAACGEAIPPEAPLPTPQTVEKTLVFADGTTARFAAQEYSDAWIGEISAGPVVMNLNGTREGDRFEFPSIDCSSYAALSVDLAGVATFSHGLFSVDAKVTDSVPEKLHPATGEFTYFADGITFPNEVTSYSVATELPVAALDNLLIMQLNLWEWRVKPSTAYAKKMTIGPLMITCSFLGELLRSNEFRLQTTEAWPYESTGKFGEAFTSVTFNFPETVTQTSKKISHE